MKLYKTYDTNGGLPPVWTTSQAAASKAKTEMTGLLKADDKPHRNVEYKPVDVTPTRDGLIEFLNSADAR